MISCSIGSGLLDEKRFMSSFAVATPRSLATFVNRFSSQTMKRSGRFGVKIHAGILTFSVNTNVHCIYFTTPTHIHIADLLRLGITKTFFASSYSCLFLLYAIDFLVLGSSWASGFTESFGLYGLERRSARRNT